MSAGTGVYSLGEHVPLYYHAGRYSGPTSWNSLSDSLQNINLTLQTLQKTRYVNPLLLL